jgi:hypothetical protein
VIAKRDPASLLTSLPLAAKGYTSSVGVPKIDVADPAAASGSARSIENRATHSRRTAAPSTRASVFLTRPRHAARPAATGPSWLRRARPTAMIISATVTIVLNGSIVASVASARIGAGRVVAPLSPIVVRLASSVSYDPATATVTIQRNDRRIVVPAAFVEDDMPFVELGPIVQRLGGSATFDTRTKTLAINMRAADPIATPAPFDRTLPQPVPTSIFTPAAGPSTPRAIETGVPRPRRTAIPAVPSQPIPPAGASADPTSPRR